MTTVNRMEHTCICDATFNRNDNIRLTYVMIHHGFREADEGSMQFDDEREHVVLRDSERYI